MLLTADLMRVLLAISAAGMTLLGALYLSRRRMPLKAYLGWGMLVILVPFLGPFLTIFSQPGEPAQ